MFFFFRAGFQEKKNEGIYGHLWIFFSDMAGDFLSQYVSLNLFLIPFIFLLRFDGSDMRMRFWNWWFFGYNNAFRNDDEREGSVGLGGNISGIRKKKCVFVCQ